MEVPWSVRDTWLGAACLGLWLALAYAGVILLKSLAVDISAGLLVALLELALLLPVWWLAGKKHGARWRDLGIRGFKARYVGLGLGLFFPAMWVNALYESFLSQFGLKMQPELERILTGTPSPGLFIFAAVILAPAVEEIFFRGFLFAGLKKRFSWPQAMLISSGLFALLHLLVPEEFPSEAGFKQRLAWNEPIVRAASLVRRPGTDRLAEAASAVREVAARGLAQTALFDELLQLLENDGEDTPARRVELQQRLNELNLLSNVFTRTKRKDVHLNVAQRQAVVPVASLSDYEQVVYDTISNFIFEEYQHRHGDGAAQLVLVTYQRQIASSLPAAVRKFLDAIAGMESAWDDEMETPEDDIQSDSEDVARYRPAADPAFHRLIGEIDINRLEREDTKYDLLKTAIRQQHSLAASGERRSRKLIVFSYFRRSLDYLERRLDEDGFRFVRVDGNVRSTPENLDTDERGRRIDIFRFDPDVDVLLTSEVSSEGIDLQFCDTIVNWDLPWNPMVVEQRIGRIDRIGQESPKIFITNIASQGTIEARILQRLYARIGIFEHSIGELEPILGDIVRELEDHLFRPHLTADQQEQVIHARELAIETQRSTQAALEDQAELLIGHDEFFHNQLDNIRRLGRYVGGDELRLFVVNELRSAIPGLDLIADDLEGVYRLPYRHELGAFIDQMLPRGDEEGMRFMDRLRSGKDKVTFDGELADKYPQVDPFHANHPLVRALAGRIEAGISSQPQVACVRLPSSLVKPGPRFFGWALVNESGFLKARSLMSVVIDLTGKEMSLLDDDTADHLLAEMIRQGEPWADFSAPGYTDAEQCLRLAHEHIIGRVHDLDQRRRQRVEGIKQARHATIEATFDLRIQRQRERTSEIERRAISGDEGASRILRAFRARLERLESDRELQLERIEALPLGTVTYEMLGAGFVDIVVPKEGPA